MFRVRSWNDFMYALFGTFGIILYTYHTCMLAAPFVISLVANILTTNAGECRVIFLSFSSLRSLDKSAQILQPILSNVFFFTENLVNCFSKIFIAVCSRGPTFSSYHRNASTGRMISSNGRSMKWFEQNQIPCQVYFFEKIFNDTIFYKRKCNNCGVGFTQASYSTNVAFQL